MSRFFDVCMNVERKRTRFQGIAMDWCFGFLQKEESQFLHAHVVYQQDQACLQV
jgi:hypothetical protein